MKKSRYDENKHIGKQPIRVLHELVITFFNNLSKDFNDELQSAIDYSGFNETIVIITDNKIIDTAYITNKKQIHISETFLSYLWCFCYCLIIFLLYFHPLHKDDIKMNADKKQKYKDDCISLFKYALSLQKGYSLWDVENLPNPEYYNETENPYIEKVNKIYMIAVSFILAHEFAHFQLGHLNEDKGEIVVCPEDELRADDFAFKTIMEYEDSDIDKDVLKYGCTFGLCSLIFLHETLKDEKKQYPDADVRIRKIIEKDYDSEDDIIWQVSSLALILWGFLHGVDIDDRTHKTDEELFDILANGLK